MVKRNYLILLLLLLIFIAPGSMAYLLYTHPQWLGKTTTNRGTLLNPPVQLVNVKSKGKWRLILWNPGDCNDVCVKQIDKLARIRLALGRRLYEVEQWLIVDEEMSHLSPSLMNLLKDEDIQIQYLSKEARAQLQALNDKSTVFISNPNDYLILSYDLAAKSDAIFYDIKHLLGVEKKNG